jgi:tetratricopeptide (TPR) repeat protein
MIGLFMGVLPWALYLNAKKPDRVADISHEKNMGLTVSGIDTMENSEDLFPDDPIVTASYDEAWLEYQDSVINTAKRYIQGGNYTVAIDYLEKILERYPDADSIRIYYYDLQNDYQTVERNNALDKASQQASEGDYAGAMDVIKAAMDKLGESEELAVNLAFYEKCYVDAVITDVVENYIEYNVESIKSSIEKLKNAQRTVPDNTTLQEKISYYQGKLPIPVASLDYYTISALDWEHGIIAEEKDNYGETRSNCFVQKGDSAFHENYYLNQEYSMLTGTLYKNNTNRERSGGPWLEIKGDGEVLYDHTMEVGEEPVYFEVDVRNCQVLEISFDAYVCPWDIMKPEYYTGGISNFVLYK